MDDIQLNLTAGIAREAEMDAWAQELADRTRQGTFFSSVAYVVVLGVVKPTQK